MAKETVTQAKADQAASLFGEIATLANATRKVHAATTEGDDAHAICRLIETIGWMADHGQKALTGSASVGSAQDWVLHPDSMGEANV